MDEDCFFMFVHVVFVSCREKLQERWIFLLLSNKLRRWQRKCRLDSANWLEIWPPTRKSESVVLFERFVLVTGFVEYRYGAIAAAATSNVTTEEFLKSIQSAQG